MASSTLLFAAVLLAAVAAPAAQAQLLGLIHIDGTVHCSAGAETNALVQLRCGGNVVSSAPTNSDGLFTMSLNLLVSTLLSSCNLVVDTPLATCDASLPTGGILQSGLQLIGSPLRGIVSLAPTGFSIVQSLV